MTADISRFPQFIGPVDIQDSFMIVQLATGPLIPYVLVNNLSDPNNYYMSSNLNLIGLQTSISIFRAVGSPGSLVLQDIINGGSLTVNSSGNLVRVPSITTPINIRQTTAQEWKPPDVLLSRVLYNFFDSSNRPVRFLQLPTGSNPPAATQTTSFAILPVTLYTDCNPALKTYGIINNPLAIISSWFCNAEPINFCDLDTFPREGWSNLPDCYVGNLYSYCPLGVNCGPDCKSPCSSDTQICTLQDNRYTCVGDPAAIARDALTSEWWKSPYFIGGMIGLGVLILISIIVIIALVYKQYNKPIAPVQRQPQILF